MGERIVRPLRTALQARRRSTRAARLHCRSAHYSSRQGAAASQPGAHRQRHSLADRRRPGADLMMPEPPTLSFVADDYQRLAATAQQIEASMAAIQEALDDLGSTKATHVVRKCLALDFESLEADAGELRWLLKNAPLAASSIASLQSVASGVEHTVALWRRGEHLGITTGSRAWMRCDPCFAVKLARSCSTWAGSKR